MLVVIGFCCLMALITEPSILAVSDFCCDPVETIIANTPKDVPEISDDVCKPYIFFVVQK